MAFAMIEPSEVAALAVQLIHRQRSLDERPAFVVVSRFTGEQQEGAWSDESKHLVVLQIEPARQNTRKDRKKKQTKVPNTVFYAA